MMKRVICLIIGALSFFVASDALATSISEMMKADRVFLGAIGNFIISVTSDPNSQMYQFARSMMVGFSFLGTAWMAIKWATKAIDDVEAVTYVLTAFLAFSFYFYYDIATNTFWGFSDGIAAGIQLEAVGIEDPYYLGGTLLGYIERLWVKDVSIFDGLSAIITVIMFKILSGTLNLFLTLINAWNMWGYGFCKVIGILFIPLIFLEATRPFFAKWVELLLGFWFFNMFSKIALSIFHIYFEGVFGAITEIVEYDAIADQIILSQMTVHFLVGIIFLISAGSVSASMSSAIGQISSKSGSVLRGAASMATKAFTKGAV